MLSRAEGDLLREAYKASKLGKDIIPLKYLANALDIKVSTVSATAKRLEKKELIKYFDYKGIELTPNGIKEAKHVANAHYLWEYFLLHKLGIPLEEVHQEAHNLEHATSEKVLQKLYLYLGMPEQCPYGQVIDLNIEEQMIENKKPLKDCQKNECINLIFNDDYLLLLKSLHLKAQSFQLKIIDILENNDFLVEDQHNQRFIIPSCLVKQLKVIERG